MTLEQFARAAAFVRENQMALRVFVLVKPPFLSETEALYWANRSVDFAFAHGANVVSLIPTRQGNRRHGRAPPVWALRATPALDIGGGGRLAFH